MQTQCIAVVLLVALVCTAMGMPLEAEVSDMNQKEVQTHSLWKRFVNPMFALGGSPESGVSKIRTKRGYEAECEKLSLCKLHARSHRSFFAAFQLYFVNKKNAKLWDHQARSLAECEQRFGDCYEY